MPSERSDHTNLAAGPTRVDSWYSLETKRKRVDEVGNAYMGRIFRSKTLNGLWSCRQLMPQLSANTAFLAEKSQPLLRQMVSVSRLQVQSGCTKNTTNICYHLAVKHTMMVLQ